jgi:TIR domain
MSTPLEVFCCYAREDQAMLEHLKKHLAPLQRQGQITIWSDTNIDAGVEWERELHQHLERADIILLMISPDFMSSDYCYSTEMGRAIQRHNQGSVRVIPVLLRSTFWQNAPFAKLQMVPTNAEPVTNWPDRDKAFHNITEQISQVITGRQTQPNKPAPQSVSSQQSSPEAVVSASRIDISGEWEEEGYGWKLFLGQKGTKITGTGSQEGYQVTVTGIIDGVSVKLKATKVKKSSYLPYSELNLIFVSPKKMSGHDSEYRKGGLFKGEPSYTSEVTLLRKHQ